MTQSRARLLIERLKLKESDQSGIKIVSYDRRFTGKLDPIEFYNKYYDSDLFRGIKLGALPIQRDGGLDPNDNKLSVGRNIKTDGVKALFDYLQDYLKTRKSKLDKLINKYRDYLRKSADGYYIIGVIVDGKGYKYFITYTP